MFEEVTRDKSSRRKKEPLVLLRGAEPANAQICLVDYANYPFLREAAVALQCRGWDFHYIYSASFPSPHLRSTLMAGPEKNARILGVRAPGHTFKKYSLFRRYLQEACWGRRCVSVLRRLQPSLVLSANTPLPIQERLLAWCKSNAIRFVFWAQDLHGLALRTILPRKIPLFGRLAGRYFESQERRLMRESSHVIVISEDHLRRVRSIGIDETKISVLHNWTMVEDVPLVGRANSWASEHGLAKTRNIVYSGTLGMKHDPGLLAGLAEGLWDDPAIRVVVVSEGPAANWLAGESRRRGIRNLVVLPFQPYERLCEVLGSATVLLAVLKRDASEYSVPSKVLSYLCAGRPVLLAVAAQNLAARIVHEAGAGLVVPPGNVQALVAAARSLLRDEARCLEMGRRAREYAEAEFSIERVCGRLETLLSSVLCP